MKYELDDEETLYGELEKKRKTYKKWGWLLLGISFGILVVVATIFEYALQIKFSGHIAAQISGWFFMGCLVISIILWCVSRHYKKELHYVCPMCLNAQGQVMTKDLIKEEGYEIEETQYNEVANPFSYADYDNVKYYEKNVTKKEYITDETYDVVYKCPSCKHVWHLVEKEMTYKKRTK